jgi:hypothetical protein
MPESIPDQGVVSSVNLVTKERFAVSVGVTEYVVDGWVKRGYLPVHEMGRYSLINLARLNIELLRDE